MRLIDNLHNESAGYIDEILPLTGGRFIIKGWAQHPETCMPPNFVIVIANQQVVASAVTGEARGDVALALNNQHMIHSGWTAITEPIEPLSKVYAGICI
jgi:hypothetical protein